ncbi:MAG: OmpA family protein [Acidobacteriia bacterium]|nr:OmpA family protein [Terriglobia bacterium]
MKTAKRFTLGWVMVFISLLAPALLLGQAAKPDKKGCSDSPLLSRVSGCYIYSCERNEWDAVKIAIGPGNKTQMIEGEKLHNYYECAAESYSRLKVVRNAESALRPAGYTIEFSGTYDGDPAVTARKGSQWIFVTTGTDRYWVTTVKAKEMAQEMKATAEVLASDITATGHAAVYGICFDTDKAEIKPESEPALTEMAKLLKNNAALNVFIVGHTDNTGTFEHNMKLSQDRAASVVSALVTKHGIAAARLKSTGVASLAPVASNDTEDGKAKNRRVELVKR